MAREFARVRLSIWEDADFRALTADAQHLYFLLLTSPKLDYCGVTDWREKRIARLVADWTPERVEAAGRELAERLYVVIDEESEEVLVRSFIRNDELLDSPNMAVAVRRAHGAIASSSLRAVVVHELRRLRADRPDLRGWAGRDGAPSAVIELLDGDALDPLEHLHSQGLATPSEKGSPTPSDTPSETPSETGSASPSESPSASPSERGSERTSSTGSGTPSPTTETATATATAPPSTTSSGEGRRKRRTHLPDDWKPSAADVAWQRAEGIGDDIARRELPIFGDYWRSRGEPMADWSATWKNWLRKTMQREAVGASTTGSANGRPAGWDFGS